MMSIEKEKPAGLSLYFTEDDPFDAILIKELYTNSLLVNKKFKEMFNIPDVTSLIDILKHIAENENDFNLLLNSINYSEKSFTDKPVKLYRQGKTYNFFIYYNSEYNCVIIHARDITGIEKLTNQLDDYAQGLVQNIFELEVSQKKLINAGARLSRQLKASSMLGLTSYESYKNIKSIFKIFTEIASATLEVDRCGIWLIEDNAETFRCIDMYSLQNSEHSADTIIDANTAPEIFNSIKNERLLKIEDSLNNLLTLPLIEIYFKPNSINSILLATIVSKGQIAGVVSFEHINNTRIWEDDECGFAVIFADHVSRILSDVEKHALEAQLIQTQKMETIGTLVGGLAHDFNNLLGGIVGSLSLIRYNYKKISEEGLLKYLDIMENASSRATDLVKQLLSVARKQDLKLVPVDLNTAASHIVEISKNTFDRSIEIRFNQYSTPAITDAEPIQIEQVLLNLCINACHAMTVMREDGEQQGGILTITISKKYADDLFIETTPEAQKTDYWIISVEDTGVGMNKHALERLFEPFFTTKKNTKVSGSGLGLTMVYNIIHAHKGFIKVNSEPGKGSVFTVYLPAIDQKNRGELNNKDIKAVSGEGLILIIDDEELMRITSKSILELSGYNVITAENGDEGIEIFKKHHADISAIILDMSMPKKSGKDTFYELKKIDPDLKVLLATGYMNDNRCEEILRDGVQGYIQKPFTIHDLTEAVQKILKE